MSAPDDSGTEDATDGRDIGGIGLRALLEREALDAAPPARGDRTAEVLHQAARIRARRRLAAVAGAAAVTAIAVTVGTGVLPGGSGGGGTALPAGPPSPPASAVAQPSGGKADWNPTTEAGDAHTPVPAALLAILPAGAGKVTRLAVNTDTQDRGALDGDYLLTKNGRVGGLSVIWGTRNVDTMSCAANANPDGLSCEQTDLSGGGQLLVEEFRPDAANTPHDSPFSGLRFASYYTATLAIAGGHTLFVNDVAGFTGSGAPGPAMSAPPLTKAELTLFASSSALRAGLNSRK